MLIEDIYIHYAYDIWDNTWVLISILENWAKICPKTQILAFKWPSLAYFLKAKDTKNRLRALTHIYPHTTFDRPK